MPGVRARDESAALVAAKNSNDDEVPTAVALVLAANTGKMPVVALDVEVFPAGWAEDPRTDEMAIFVVLDDVFDEPLVLLLVDGISVPS